MYIINAINLPFLVMYYVFITEMWKVCWGRAVRSQIILMSCIITLLPCSQIQDPNQVYDAINLGRRIDVVWPDEMMRAHGGRSHWRDWLPEKGMEGQVNANIIL
jgi:hypothetical protein